MLRTYLPLLLVSFSVVTGFTSVTTSAQAKATPPNYVIERFGQPPQIPQGDLSNEAKEAIRIAFMSTIQPVGSVNRLIWGAEQSAALRKLVEIGDPRVVWVISDLMRFTWQPAMNVELTTAAGSLLGKKLSPEGSWSTVTDLLIAWDIPAYPNYLSAKSAIFTNFLETWKNIFVEGDVDWRHVSWGGVSIDDRPYDTTDTPCNCIPAADNPKVTNAKNAKWLNDSDIIFGVEINGEYRAYPRQIMEVREMVNDTLGGRDIGIPYCTLCGAAQAYFTDNMPEGVKRPVLRTSGLLVRSNKVMFDIETYSVFDTFLGKALTGPLAEKGVVLEQVSVVTSDWGSWKKAYPQTTVLAEELAMGRNFDFRNGRDANGPIFPVGARDPRLPVHEDVIGVITASGKPIAFQRSKAFLALSDGQQVGVENIQLELSAGGIKAIDKDGKDLGSHQSFWFAWSQFYPDTQLWAGFGS